MATVLTRPAADQAAPETNSSLGAFLEDLAEVSRRHGIAIGDGASLYVMEREDYARAYLASDQSELTFV